MPEKEYIEREAVRDALYDADAITFNGIKILNNFPTADVAEVKHGQWEVCSDEYEICASEFVCSCCKESFTTSELTDREFFDMMKFCPNCGAKMDRKEKNNGL